jgi:hypothetical protein
VQGLVPPVEVVGHEGRFRDFRLGRCLNNEAPVACRRPQQGRDGLKSQTRLGISYYDGEGVSKDYAAALTWYRKAAEQGYAQDQNNLGRMYAYSSGVGRLYAEDLIVKIEGAAGTMIVSV